MNKEYYSVEFIRENQWHVSKHKFEQMNRAISFAETEYGLDTWRVFKITKELIASSNNDH